MSKITEYKALEAQIAEQFAKLDLLKNNSDLEREIEFEQKLHSLLAHYNFSLREVIAVLHPAATPKLAVTQQRAGRKARVVKRYKNPNTGEVIETQGGNHKFLKCGKPRTVMQRSRAGCSNHFALAQPLARAR